MTRFTWLSAYAGDPERINVWRFRYSSPGCRVDRSALGADPEVASLLVQLNRSQTILGNLHLNEQQTLETLLVALEEALSGDKEN